MIDVINLSIRVGDFALDGINFHVPSGNYGILMGKTGSGKTSIIESICGLLKPTSGTIKIMGRDVTHLKPSSLGIGFVPQDGALFSTMTVRNHLGFGLSIRKWDRKRIEKRVVELAETLRILHLLDRVPYGLSGGERQRVSLGRALSYYPNVLCVDEPFSALDDETREDMYQLLKLIIDQTGIIIFHITHSYHEARRLADKIFRIENGKILERGN